MDPFQRLPEYTTLLEDSASISNRRQGTNEVLIGFNLAILTAIGFLLVSTRFLNWTVPIVLTLTTFVMSPINLAWWRTLKFYQSLIGRRIAYLEEIEQEFRDRTGNENIGLFTRLRKEVYGEKRRGGTTHTERRIAAYLVGLYPALTICASILTVLAINKVIPQIEISF
jgi:hypothetical protein